MRHYGVKHVLIFDGGFLPMKVEQENKRARSRKENLARAIEHESSGNSAAAFGCYQKAVDISPLIAHELIQVLKQANVSYIVEAIITEDSDLIPFGCPRIIFKMDKYGQGFEFQRFRLQQNKDLSFSGFSNDMFLEMCILSGCDYLPSLPGMGLKRAHALITKFKSYDKVIKHLKYSTVCVPPLYEESFKKAILTFRHQRVYDPTSEDIVHLPNVPDDLGDDLDFLAQGIAQGDLDPFTQMPFKVLKQENVSYIVAPYEADSQMTFLAISKQVDAIITEDSDLIPFGCPRIIFKMDKYGQGFEFQRSRLQQNKDLSFSGFNNDMLLEMCILSGFDYLPSLPGMGLKRAHALITKFKCYDKVIKHLKYSIVCVPPLYEESFKKAILTFRHQCVYDPTAEDIVHLSSVSDDLGDDLDFLGPYP